MDLSVVIVNYNVRHFLDQCLRSVQAASVGLQVEVWVVDNQSVDGSVQMLREQHPWVNLIANRQNVGFAKANNQAIRKCNGRYVLLLNPDTIVQEDTLAKCIAFMDAHPDAGALGVRMVNGEGRFLPESKRSLPTPSVAFYKIFGLSRLFPRSKRFGRYHRTDLPIHQTAPVEVLSGAFMFLRHETLQQVGLLDEDYFMYGEDVDLSYRITQGGWHNYYFADTQIIHYKGESTKKGSLNYVAVFYSAMLIFVRKHFARRQAWWFTQLIRMAVYGRATASMAKRVVQRSFFPLAEGALLAGVFAATAGAWFAYTNKQVPEYVYPFVSLGYAGLYVASLSLMRAYRSPFRLRAVFGGVLLGAVAVTVANFAYPPWNASRVVAGLSVLEALVVALTTRSVVNLLKTGQFSLDQRPRLRIALVATATEAERVAQLLEDDILYNAEIVGVVSPHTDNSEAARLPVLGVCNQLPELVRHYRVEELVFCNASLSTRQLIGEISRLAPLRVSFKIVPAGADYLVGPNAVNASAALAPVVYGLHSRDLRLQKTLFDYSIGLGLLWCWPISFWVYRKPFQALRNLVRVAVGKAHLVGYIDDSVPDELPPLKQSLLDMRPLVDSQRRNRLLELDCQRLDRQYARHYSPGLDWHILWQGLRHLGDKSIA